MASTVFTDVVWCSSGAGKHYADRAEWHAKPTPQRCDYCGRTQIYPDSGGCAGCGAPQLALRAKPRTPWTVTYAEKS